MKKVGWLPLRLCLTARHISMLLPPQGLSLRPLEASLSEQGTVASGKWPSELLQPRALCRQVAVPGASCAHGEPCRVSAISASQYLRKVGCAVPHGSSTLMSYDTASYIVLLGQNHSLCIQKAALFKGLPFQTHKDREWTLLFLALCRPCNAASLNSAVTEGPTA